MKAVLTFLLITATGVALSQTRLIVVGDVKDSETNEPLAYATIGVKGIVDQTVSNADGSFELSIPSTAHADTLIVTYVGYEKFEKAIPNLASFEHIVLKEYATVLDEVRIVYRQLDLREIDRNVRVIRDNLYAMEGEVTNGEYNSFLSWLEDYNKSDLRKKCEFNLDGYEKSVKEFYQQYHKPSDPKYDGKRNGRNFISHNTYPAVNVTYEAAVEYCKWLTDRYNENPKKKKFKKVVFRLPTLKEWQIAALGYPKFQSWDLLDNYVEVIKSPDTTAILKGPREKMKVDETILYPWYKVYRMRNRPYNFLGCFMGNFKIAIGRSCPANAPAFDGFTMMSHVTAYFPNDMGLYDVVGNVAEMIDEKGKACGGSWNELPENSTIQSIKTYKGPDETVGFRVFMEVIEK